VELHWQRLHNGGRHDGFGAFGAFDPFSMFSSCAHAHEKNPKTALNAPNAPKDNLSRESKAMSVTEVNERFQDRQSVQTERGRGHVRTYDVFTDDVTDGTAVAITADDGTTAIPSVGDAHPDDTYSLCRNVDAQPKDNEPKAFVVTVTYNTQTAFAGANLSGGISATYNDDPTTDDYELEFAFVTEEEVALEDYSDPPKSIVNSAGQMFDPPVTRNVHISTMRVTKNQSLYFPSTSVTYVDTVNTADWTLVSGVVIPARQARCHSISATSQRRGTESYWRVTYEFHFKASGWNPTGILDQGLMVRDGNGDLVAATDANDEQVPFPINLDGMGQALPPAPPFASVASHYEPFNLYRETNFNNLNLFA